MDAQGNIYVTFSGQRGQRVPVSLYKITANFTVKPYVTKLMNPTGLALDHDGVLFVSCRDDGTIFRVASDGQSETMDRRHGRRHRTSPLIATAIFSSAIAAAQFSKSARTKEIFVFATLEPSIAAYHLALNPDGDLFVTGPTTSSFDRVFRINRQGEISTFYRGLGRPQGMAFDAAGNLYVTASLGGRRGIVRISPDGQRRAGGRGQWSGGSGAARRVTARFSRRPAPFTASIGTSKA